jgi:pyruvate/2-oxoglutarate dehydrogenase complex dihydrolipoamide dehydrogenase (E3) component
MRKLRAQIAPVDGHGTSVAAGTHVFQGRGKFMSPNTVQVNNLTLTFKKAVIATGGRPMIPNIPGLKSAPYTTNEVLFNMEVLPPRMVILGAGVVALEMAQSFATFGSTVTVLQRGKALFESKQGDPDAANLLREELEKSGVQFLSGATKHVETLRERPANPTEFPLMKITVKGETGDDVALECECLLVATGRVANVENLGLEDANVEYELGHGVRLNDFAQSVSNPGTHESFLQY